MHTDATVAPSPMPAQWNIWCRHCAQRALLVRFRAPVSQIPRQLTATLQLLIRALREQHTEPVGPPFVAYHEVTSQYADMEVGVPVSDAVHGAGEVHIGSLPMGRYLTFVLQGSAQTLADGCREMEDWLALHHERTQGPLYVVVPRNAELPHGETLVLIQRQITAGTWAAREPRVAETARTERATATSEAASRAASALAKGLLGISSQPTADDGPGLVSKRVRDVFLEGRGAMHVKDAMSTGVYVCSQHQPLRQAAELMWQHDIGAVPVVDDQRRPIAMITDRDICMAAYTQGKTLQDIPISTAMSKRVYMCRLDDSLYAAERAMATHQVRRLPVVDDKGALVGVLSMNDVVLAQTRTPISSAVERLLGDVTSTLAAISQHRGDAGPLPTLSGPSA